MSADQEKSMTGTTLQASQLQRMLSGQTILQDISLTVAPGDVVGLLGKNGSGKTTLLETLLGFGFASFGNCSVWGEESTKMSSDCKQRIGYVPQRDELPGEMTAKQLFHLYRQLRPRWDGDMVERLMPAWELSETKRIRRMSEGQKQKLAIVLALAHQPELLVLDEPVASLDPIARRQFFQQLMDYACSDNRAIIFSSHIVSDMERIVNRIWCLQGGQLSCDRTLDDLYESVVRVSYKGELAQAQKVAIEGLLHSEEDRVGGQLILNNWSQGRLIALQNCGLENITVSGLSLEEIFLYLHGAKHE
ncbi:ABC transporter ATP-binding protein [Gilvimarinus sp. SDUM040013]|uniref:ABC transporter ATP-binding protein n=1 Tax=Gilvimarinus gilvus TaxID=3058038 RepID=A0ABU4S0Y7_9GAMM|nr:ABC transporter ATP-binding protein [Gilvimarinus sp. SDUM040013]MDO3384698.1 ABC transporter ATP-binding protein [Gilvimarinus sp. SDUM040013]MDX6850827.1 ABC transporter ATP-binding protein [Gilvimarinus sp. SDUM040013]